MTQDIEQIVTSETRRDTLHCALSTL